MAVKFPYSLDTINDLYRASDKGQSTLAVSIEAADTSIQVASGTSFPTGRFVVSIGSEIIIVASRTGDILTVEERGAHNTTAATAASGEPVLHNFVAAMWEQLTAAVATIEAEQISFRHPVNGVENDPPVSPSTGDRYLVGAAPTGAWATFAQSLVHWDGTEWIATAPSAGWVVYVIGDNTIAAFSGTTWELVSLTDHTHAEFTTLTDAIAAKASQDDLDELALEVGTLATQSALDTLSDVVDGKADQSAVDAKPDSFLELADVAVDYTDNAGKFVAVNSTADGLEFVDPPSAEVTQVELDALATIVSGKAAQGDLDTLTTAVADKADQSAVDGLTTALGGKASQGDLDTLTTTVAAKPDSFLELSDVTGDYTGAAGKVVAVNTAADGLEFIDAATGGGASTLLDLTDVTGAYAGNAGKVLAVNDAETGAEFITIPAGAVAFSDLTDVPASYEMNEGRVLAVNGTGDGLEYVDIPSPEVTQGELDAVIAVVDAKPDSLAELSDVNLTGLAIGQTLVWDGTDFVPASPPEAGDLTIVTKTDDYTIVNADRLIRGDSASVMSIVVPSNAYQPIAIGREVLVEQAGTGQVEIGKSVGVTLNAPGKRKLRTRYSLARLIKIGTDEWLLGGDIETGTDDVSDNTDTPTITTSTTQEGTDEAETVIALTADETIVEWRIVGGADQALYSIENGDELVLPAKDYSAPEDVGSNNTYVVTVRAFNVWGNYSDATITTTIIDTDVIAPTISTSSSQTVVENSGFSVGLTASESVTWSIVGGADQALFSLVGSTLSMAAKDYESPTDADASNTYVVIVRATDPSSNYTDKTITVTVTDVFEAGANDELFVRFDSTSAVDGYGKHTVAIAGASIVNTGPNGNALRLAGSTSSYVDYGVATEWDFLWKSTGDYTVEMIVRAVTDPHYSVFGNTTSTSHIGATLSYRGTNQWTWDIENGSTRAARVDCPTNTGNEANWVHLAIVKQGTTIKFYINGTLQRTVTGASFSTNNGSGQLRYRSGSHSDNTYASIMEIDSIRIRKTAVYTSNFTAPTALTLV